MIPSRQVRQRNFPHRALTGKRAYNGRAMRQCVDVSSSGTTFALPPSHDTSTSARLSVSVASEKFTVARRTVAPAHHTTSTPLDPWIVRSCNRSRRLVSWSTTRTREDAESHRADKEIWTVSPCRPSRLSRRKMTSKR